MNQGCKITSKPPLIPNHQKNRLSVKEKPIVKNQRYKTECAKNYSNRITDIRRTIPESDFQFEKLATFGAMRWHFKGRLQVPGIRATEHGSLPASRAFLLK